MSPVQEINNMEAQSLFEHRERKTGKYLNNH